MSLLPQIYDKFILNHDFKTKMLDFISQHLKGECILDCGCGTGWISHHLANKGYRIDAFDSDPGMIDYAKQHYAHDHIHFFLQNMRDVDLHKMYDSIIVMTDTLNFFQNSLELKTFIDLCHQHLVLGGVLIFDVYDVSVIETFAQEYLEEAQVEDVYVQWSIQSVEQTLSHVLMLENLSGLKETHHFTETLFNASLFESILNEKRFSFLMNYDFDESHKKGMKRVYVATKQ